MVQAVADFAGEEAKFIFRAQIQVCLKEDADSGS